MAPRLIEQDTRFWEVFNEQGESLGLFMYYDLIIQFTNGHGILSTALDWLKYINHTWKVVGDICPLEEDSDIPEIQAKKIKYRQREKDREKKQAKKRGFRLESKIHFGKHKGETIKTIIDKFPSYWKWLLENNVLLIHPETKQYSTLNS